MISRAHLRLAAAALALGALVACGSTKTLRAADPAQAIDGAPNEGQAEIERVVVRAAVGDWHGEPKDLEQRLTPVDVLIRNDSGRPIRLGPEAFKLVTNGTRLRVLTQGEVTRALSENIGFTRQQPPPPRTGAVGGSTFPGYDNPNPYGPGSQSPPGSPIPEPSRWYPTQSISGTLEHGKRTAVLLFFDTPGRTLRSAAFEVELVDEDGVRIGTIRMPFDRE